ncbi:P2Y purinoceptor 13-like [Mugil cephalus]|uniref:P2Y purinoceptor 13-like n=1 Tax=Mugil cephalus TaxID=48193 RepID=UPI001FB60482|nr:P2Y purinoceptor 13-like [Mugil cephalus]
MDEWFDLLESGEATPNQTSREDSPCAVYDPRVVPSMFFAMFPIALLLNGVATWVSLHLKSTSTFVVYLKNLVAADVIMTVNLLIKAAVDLPGVSNEMVILSCRCFSVFFYSTMYTSIALLGLISLDRFFKILLPHSKFGQNLTVSKLISGLMWVILFGCTGLPNIILSNKPVVNMTKITTCMLLKGPVGLKFHKHTVIFLNAFFWFVSVIIVVCYICIANKVIQSFRNSGSTNSQGKQKVKLRVFLVIIVFFVSFGPYHIVRIPYTFMQVSSSSSFTDCSFVAGKFMKELSLWLATTNVCMDPLIYVFLCREFKEKLLSMMKNALMSCKAVLGNKA